MLSAVQLMDKHVISCVLKLIYKIVMYLGGKLRTPTLGYIPNNDTAVIFPQGGRQDGAVRREENRRVGDGPPAFAAEHRHPGNLAGHPSHRAVHDQVQPVPKPAGPRPGFRRQSGGLDLLESTSKRRQPLDQRDSEGELRGSFIFESHSTPV